VLRKCILFFLFLGLLGGIAGGIAAVWGYFYITRDLPKLETLADYRPPAVTRVLASSGELIGEFYTERRYPVRLHDVPPVVRNAFLAAEDASFYQHAGIDFVSILRALVKNLQTGTAKQGGSTITQQVVKNLLLTPEKKLKRKAKEAILSYRLEKRFSKDDILEMYLNQIFFGNTAYGLLAASRLYFHKEVSELTLAEAALLAGLPKAPSKHSPISNPEAARRRQLYVLDQMVKAGFVSREAAEAAKAEKIQVYPAKTNTIFAAPYFVSEVRRTLESEWPHLRIDSDGLEIRTTLDLAAHHIAERALRRGLKEVDKRRGWRGPKGRGAELAVEQTSTEPLDPETIYDAVVLRESVRGVLEVSVEGRRGSVNLREAEWAKRFLDEKDAVLWGDPATKIRKGDVIEVSLVPESPDSSAKAALNFQLDQTPQIEGALVAIDPNSGRVVTVEGGYSYRRSQFNRATQSLRQPGSAFKPVVYLAAVDGFRYTPATIVHDEPRAFRVGDDVWQPANYDEGYLGPITLRTALERSRNIISAEIISTIGVDAVIQMARKLGISADLGRNLSLSLGSSEVTVLEMVRAYGVLAAKGTLAESTLIEEIRDREGKVLFRLSDARVARTRAVVSEQSAFILANMLKGVVERGTGQRVKALQRPVAGKTGTSNDQMDAWFIGFTPQWVSGVWVGFDTKREIGPKETGGRVAAPIFLEFMQAFLEKEEARERERLVAEAKKEADALGIRFVEPTELPAADFSVPDGVDPFWINRTSGLLTSSEDPEGFYEYFVRGTEPKRAVGETGSATYLESPDL